MKKFCIIINKNFCKRCSICIHFCPKNVFGIDKDGYPLIVNQDKCTRCILCFYRCPDFALEVKT